MVERRTISDAVDLTPKLEAFIKGGVPTESTQTAKTANSEQPQAAEPDSVVEMPTSVATTTRLRTRARKTPRNGGVGDANEADPHTASLLDEMLVPLTTKLRRKTVHALRRAYLEQKLNGQKPATQQEIIEEAVYEWLSQNGFLTA